MSQKRIDDLRNKIKIAEDKLKDTNWQEKGSSARQDHVEYIEYLKRKLTANILCEK